MRAYRLTVNLKLGLVFFAVAIAVASVVYTNQLAHRLREREHFFIQLWARALEQLAHAQPVNPHMAEFRSLREWLTSQRGRELPGERIDSMLRAIAWAESMPPEGEALLTTEIMTGNIGIPAIVTDSSGTPSIFRNVSGIPDSAMLNDGLNQKLIRLASGMSESIPIVQDFGTSRLALMVHYDESRLISELRIFPYIQLLFVSLFILLGYMGFSYVRRSEQRSLWVGMAKEAAHQLGTPISSLMGWLELLRLQESMTDPTRRALDEIDNDIDRLKRVASRFSDIGSLPKLEVMSLSRVIQGTADYMRRRIPQQGKRVSLSVSIPNEIRLPLNAELFEWVIENLLKNALDAIETAEGSIEIKAAAQDSHVYVDVRDTGKGIDRRNWKNVFRPGYSTKKRGWGLGLSLAKRIVEDYHGGTLTVYQSKPGHGTTFRIDLPVTGSK